MKAPIISVSEAQALIRSHVTAAPAVPMALDDALGRALAGPVIAPADQPALDQSSIDGYAVAAGSKPGTYELAGEWLPGSEPARSAPASGRACRVFTGTPLPPDCALVMVEDSVDQGKRVELKTPPATTLIRKRGESVRQGTRLLREGLTLGAGEIALLASVGVARPTVFPPPGVLHLTTGREVIVADQPAAAWQIRDSNGPLLRAMLVEAGYPTATHIHVDESVDAMVDAIETAPPFDLLCVSGGSSVGRYDNTARALTQIGFEPVFHRVRVRPGKPLLFAQRGRQWAFGIPGNPVAHFAVFHGFIRHALAAFSGQQGPRILQARLTAATAASSDPRETLWPAVLELQAEGLTASPQAWVHSGDLAALRRVNALIHFPHSSAAAAGDMVAVIVCGSSSANAYAATSPDCGVPVWRNKGLF